MDLECDQVIDFASQSKESLLSHRMFAAVATSFAGYYPSIVKPTVDICSIGLVFSLACVSNFQVHRPSESWSRCLLSNLAQTREQYTCHHSGCIGFAE